MSLEFLPANPARGTRAPVRLRACVVKGVRVPLRHALRPVTECNCVAARRGRKQQEVNDQSVG